MDIKILDSHLRDYLKTEATPKTIAEKMSLASVSIERVEKYGNDFIYNIEVTTNRPDLASVVGIAREASAVLPQAGIEAKFLPPKLKEPRVKNPSIHFSVEFPKNHIYRVLGVVMEVTNKPSPKYIQDRLEAEGIRSLNNLIDVTNYTMRTIGHPTHVFDYDRLLTNVLTLREAKKGEKITTLDGKTYELPGGDLIADNNKGIVDLLCIMGLENSVITDDTKRIFFFLDNIDPLKVRKTSMTLGIRTEAAQLNEKGIDPHLAFDALLFGINLYEEVADGKIVSNIIDDFPNPPKPLTVSVDNTKVSRIIGVAIPLSTSVRILKDLGFTVETNGTIITATPPTSRQKDIQIEEDIIEEIARIYGYHNVPTSLPPLVGIEPLQYGKTVLFWEKRVKDLMKYYGFTELYTYSMVSEELYEGPTEDAVKIKNFLSEEQIYMRTTIVPSLLEAVRENKTRDEMHLFEIANVYKKREYNLPDERRMFAGVINRKNISFFQLKGLIEQILSDMGILHYTFKPSEKSGEGASIYIGKDYIGELEVLDKQIADFELNFDLLSKHATLKKSYTPLSKHPQVVEDLSFIIDETVSTQEIIETIRKQSTLIRQVTLLDRYTNSRTFHIIYQDSRKNLTNEEVAPIRKMIVQTLEKGYKAKLKS